MTPWQQYKAKWSVCRLCSLCETRRNVVLVRGSLPADILFIGEAPGSSENLIGKPFIGPAGTLLDDIIRDSVRNRTTYALTNIIACIPAPDENGKYGEPTKESIKACRPRLLELVRMCAPKLIINVGRQAQKHTPSDEEIYIKAGLPWNRPTQYADIVHPSAILQAHITQRGLMIQRAALVISDAVDALLESNS